MRPLNILFMAHLAPPRHCAGAEMMLLSMLQPLAERGHNVRWQLSRNTPDTKPYDLKGITVHPKVNIDELRAAVVEADVVISHLENMPIATTLARVLGRPFIHVMHNDADLSRAWSVDDASAVITNSRWMDDAFGNPENGHILRPPVIGSDYSTTPGTKVTLINLNEAKGGEIVQTLAERMPDVEFLGVVGAYGDQIIPELPNVEIREHGGDMRQVYASTRILLMPSSYESWGRVGVEAMHSGIPVIAHPTPGLLESLGAAGVFADRTDVETWEAQIRRLLKPRAWSQASKAARARAGELDPTNDLEAWCELVESIGDRQRTIRRLLGAA